MSGIPIESGTVTLCLKNGWKYSISINQTKMNIIKEIDNNFLMTNIYDDIETFLLNISHWGSCAIRIMKGFDLCFL